MDRFFGLDRSADINGLSLLASFYDPVSLSIAEELLHDAGIPYMKKERGSGGAVRVIAGFQTFGSDIFVREEDKERAAETIAPLTDPLEGENGDE